MASAGHGPNIGHGYVKYVVIDKEGNELPPVVFPAMISRAARSVAGAIARVDTVSAGGAQWWTGEDALLAPSPLTILASATRGYFQGQVDAAGPRCQGRLQNVGAVGGEQEQHVGIIGQPVHLVKQLEEQGVGAGVLAGALLGDQVHVFEDDRRRLEQARQLAGLFDQPEAAPGEQDDRALRHLAGKVHRGKGLASARRAVEQQATLEVTPRGLEPLAQAREAHRLALDALQHPGRQNYPPRAMLGGDGSAP